MPRKPKKPPIFYFRNMSAKNMVELLDKECPIDLRYNEDLVDRVHVQYPLASKTEVATVIKEIFNSMRDLLFFGKIFNFHKMFFDTKLYFRAHSKAIKKHRFALRVSMKTPPPLRRHVSKSK